jgi:hypothetical protein
MAMKKTEVIQIKTDLLVKLGIGAAFIFLIPLSILGSRSIVYNNMSKKMQNVASYSDLDTIERNLNYLPYDYRDSQQIRSELQLILNDLSLIRKSDFNKDYLRMRISYYNLELLNNTLFKWNLTDLLDNQHPLITLAGSYGDYYNYFNLEPCGSSPGFCLYTNLPNEKISTNEYFYTVDNLYELFGYENKNNKNETFDAFRIIGVFKDKIQVFSFKSKITYDLERTDD